MHLISAQYRSPSTFAKIALHTFQILLLKLQGCCIACCLGRECIFVSVQIHVAYVSVLYTALYTICISLQISVTVQMAV